MTNIHLAAFTLILIAGAILLHAIINQMRKP
jgi:hypothetical protein